MENDEKMDTFDIKEIYFKGVIYGISDDDNIIQKILEDENFAETYFTAVTPNKLIENNIPDIIDEEIVDDENDTSIIEPFQWTSNHIRFMLEAFQKRLDRFRVGAAKKQMWTEIRQDFQISENIYITEIQLKEKFVKLSKIYNQIKSNQNRYYYSSNKITWQFYDLFEEIFNNTEKFNIDLHTTSTLNLDDNIFLVNEEFLNQNMVYTESFDKPILRCKRLQEIDDIIEFDADSLLKMSPSKKLCYGLTEDDNKDNQFVENSIAEIIGNNFDESNLQASNNSMISSDFKWTRDSIEFLLQTYQKRIGQTKDSDIKYLWMDIKHDFKTKKNVIIAADMLKKKLAYIRNIYNNIKYNNNGNNTLWEFYDICDRIFGKYEPFDPETQTLSTLDLDEISDKFDSSQFSIEVKIENEKLDDEDIEWTYSTTEFLLTEYLKRINQFRKMKNSRHLWHEIETEYWDIKNIPITAARLNAKFKQLKNTYKTIKLKQKESICSTVNWKYYQLFEEIFKNNEEFHTEIQMEFNKPNLDFQSCFNKIALKDKYLTIKKENVDEFNWTKETIKFLLLQYRNRMHRFKENQNKYLREIKEEFHKKNWFVSEDQIHKKINSLIDTYENLKRNSNIDNKNWEYFDFCEKLFKVRQQIPTVSSMDDIEDSLDEYYNSDLNLNSKIHDALIEIEKEKLIEIKYFGESINERIKISKETNSLLAQNNNIALEFLNFFKRKK